MFTYNKLRNICHITLKQNMQMRSRGEKTGHKAKQTTHSLQTSGTFSTEQELECPHPRTQKKTETHTHTVNRKTCINPLTSSCWRWAQAPLCAVWSCAASSSSPANTPEISSFSLATVQNKAKFTSLVALWCRGPVGFWTWARISFSAWHSVWYRAPRSDLPLATANENAALLRDSEREGCPRGHCVSTLHSPPLSEHGHPNTCSACTTSLSNTV